ncbi:MAG: TM1812 family CRISPR-associated protein [Sulfolobales archaeon]
MSDLIISVWGDPTGWRCVNKYKVEMSRSDLIHFYEASKAYKSSLGVLMEAYPDARVLLFVSSTLGDPRVGSYGGLVKRVEDYVGSHLSNVEFCGDRSKVSVVVLPGVGRFKDSRSFVGGVEGFRVAAFLKAYECMLEYRPKRVVLDLTHGLNYMPTYVRLSVFDALTCYSSLSKDYRVELLVYNSEPFPVGASYAEELTVMLVEDYLFDFKSAQARLYHLVWDVLRNVSSLRPVKSLFGKRLPSYQACDWKSLFNCVKKFVSAVSWGPVILLAEAVEVLSSIDLERLRRELSRFSYLCDCEDLVRFDDGVLSYLYSPSFNAALVLGLADVIKRLDLRFERFDGGFRGADLERTAEILLSGVANTLFEHEWSQLKDRLELARVLSLDVGRWVRYNAFIKLGEIRFQNKPLLQMLRNVRRGKCMLDFNAVKRDSASSIEAALAEGEAVEEVDKRNFVAHAGLEKNVTLVCEKNHDVYVKYDERLRERVNRILAELFMSSYQDSRR